MFEKPAATLVPIDPHLAQRWSGRAYDPDRSVARDDLLALLEAARWSPSCFGYQPWRFLVWDRRAQPELWQRAFACLAEGNRSWAMDAPLLMLACADTCFADGKANRWNQYDTGAATMSLSVQATALGLMVHQMGGFSVAAVREAFAIPEDIDCMAMLSIGYQLPRERIPAALSEREQAARTRRALSETCFAGDWGIPLI
jgi:nitroreductase